jgi:hypothetical protein
MTKGPGFAGPLQSMARLIPGMAPGDSGGSENGRSPREQGTARAGLVTQVLTHQLDVDAVGHHVPLNDRPHVADALGALAVGA